jgi:hypothetical protein
MPVNVLTTNLKQQSCKLPDNIPYVQHNSEIVNIANPAIQVHCTDFPFGLVNNEGVGSGYCGSVSDKCSARIKSGPISAVSVANPTIITSVGHNIPNGSTITISGTSTTPSINNSYIITVITVNTFSISVNVTVVSIGIGAWTRILTQSKTCAAFSMVTNKYIPEYKLDMCNYPNYDSVQLNDLEVQRDALVGVDAGNVLDTNDVSLWYQKKSLQSNMPASIPFTQHVINTKDPYPSVYPEVGDCCPPGNVLPCSACFNHDDGENCNTRQSCNSHPFPLSGPILKCPSVQSIPYAQHRLCPIPQKTFGTITPANFGNLLNYSITLVNNLVNYQLSRNIFNTMIQSMNVTTSTVELKPLQIYSGIIHIASSVGAMDLVLPTASDMCTDLSGVISSELVGKTFVFAISNNSTQIVTVTAVDPTIYSTWNAGINNILNPGQSADFNIFIQSCQTGTEAYYIIRNNDYSINV